MQCSQVLLTIPTLFRTHYKQPIKIQHVNVSALFNENKNVRSPVANIPYESTEELHVVSVQGSDF
jgi:hypothetical protein